MPKIRGIKPDFWTDKNIVALSPLARLLYLGLWNYAADCGHLEDEPVELKMRVLPVDNCDVDALLDELVNGGRITRTNGVIFIPRLTEHQKTDKRYFTACDACKNAGLRPSAPSSHAVQAPSTDPNPAVTTSGARRGHAVTTTEPLGDGDGDGDGDGERAPARKPRAHQIPTDFTPNDTNHRIAQERHVNLDDIVPNFIDHHRAKGTTYKDWHLALNTWIRREKPGNAPPPPRRLVHVRDIEQPPDGLTDAEMSQWLRAQRERRGA